MSIQLIFEPDEKHVDKDIIFFTPYTSLVLPVVHITLDTCLMPSCSNMLAVYN